MTYQDLQHAAKKILEKTDGENAAFLSWELLAFVTGSPKEKLIANRQFYAAEKIVREMAAVVERKRSGEPLAYILGQWQFMDINLTVTPDVLIPRDDTAAVADMARRTIRRLPRHNPRVLDLCTGSGCIGLSIAAYVSDARVTLADISRPALRVARKNAAALGLGGRATCLQIDARKPATDFLGQFDMVVSNPPYVTSAEMKTLEPSVRDYEPKLALDGGADGLDFYRDIIRYYTDSIRSEGYFCFEFGLGQETAVCALLERAGFEIREVRKDMNDIKRAVLAQRPPEPDEEENLE